MHLTIVIIDDNSANLELMRYLLAAAGHVVHASRNGVEGVALTRQYSPDVVLSDIQMGPVDGYEVARRLKLHDGMQAIPLVAVTASAMPSEQQRILAAGFKACITKPIEPRDFAASVESIVSSLRNSIQ